MREVNGAKQLKLGDINSETKSLELDKVSNGLEEINSAGQSKLGETGHGADRLRLGKVSDSRPNNGRTSGKTGDSRADDGKRGSGRVDNRGVGGSGRGDSKRGNIGILKKSSPLGLIWIPL